MPFARVISAISLGAIFTIGLHLVPITVWAAEVRLGLEHGLLLPADESFYDGRDSIHFLGLKEAVKWPKGWGLEFSQRLHSPQNRLFRYGARTGGLQPRGADRYHLRYSAPLVLLVRYDFQREGREALLRPYLGAGLGAFYTARVFERTIPPTVIEKVDRQAPIGFASAAGIELLRTSVKILIELRYEVFSLEESFPGSGDDGTGGGTSMSIGVIF